MNKAAVILASVPWRKLNMICLVNDILAQNYPVVLLLDGYPPDGEIQALAENGNVTVDAVTVRGQIERWKRATNYELFAILDDDIKISRAFLDESFAELKRTGAALVTYAGWTKEGRHVGFASTSTNDRSMELFHASTAFGYGRDIAEFWASEFGAPEMIARYMELDDEGLISAFYKSRDKRIVYPAGQPLCESIEDLARDARRLYTKSRLFMRGFRRELGLNTFRNATGMKGA